MKNNPKKKEIYEKIRNYYIILKHGFYFSYRYHLTLSLPRQHYYQPPKNYIWNRYLLSPLDDSKISPYWKTPIIQGFVGSF